MQELKVRVNYPTDPKILDELETRAARAIAKAWANELPPEKFDELIEKLSKSLNS